MFARQSTALIGVKTAAGSAKYPCPVIMMTAGGIKVVIVGAWIFTLMPMVSV